jgi:hypothetical protein
VVLLVVVDYPLTVVVDHTVLGVLHSPTVETEVPMVLMRFALEVLVAVVVRTVIPAVVAVVVATLAVLGVTTVGLPEVVAEVVRIITVPTKPMLEELELGKALLRSLLCHLLVLVPWFR